MINTAYTNSALGELTHKIAEWHGERNLIDGATTDSQTNKLLEEFIELVAAQMPDQTPKQIGEKVVRMVNGLYSAGRIKTVSADEADEALKDALGDMYVVQVNIAERESLTMEDCISSSYDVIKDRGGKMIDGIFVKEEDLVDTRKVIPINATHKDHEGFYYKREGNFWVKYVSGGWHIISGEPIHKLESILMGPK